MRDYLLHFFDLNEHLRRSIRLQAEADEDAVREAERHTHSGGLEVWEGDRCIWRSEG